LVILLLRKGESRQEEHQGREYRKQQAHATDGTL
jgi:hypothetical protein